MNIESYKQKLVTLARQLHDELSAIAIENSATHDWEAIIDHSYTDDADENMQADAAEDAASRLAILADLEIRYRNVMRALEKIECGTYGICEISGYTIEEDRLAANPAARTCIAHKDDEATLPL